MFLSSGFSSPFYLPTNCSISVCGALIDFYTVMKTVCLGGILSRGRRVLKLDSHIFYSRGFE